MKIKKLMAGILSAAMVVTLMPTMAFASSVNTVGSAIPAVGTEEGLPSSSITLKVDNDGGWAAGEMQHIRLSFNNAKFASDAVKPSTTPSIPGNAEVTTVTLNADVNGTSSQKVSLKNVLATGDYTYAPTANVTKASAAGIIAAAINGNSSSLYTAVSDDIDKITLTGKVKANLTDVADNSSSTAPTVTVVTDGAANQFNNMPTIAATNDGDLTGFYGEVLAVGDEYVEFTFASVSPAPKDSLFTFTFADGQLKSKTDEGDVSIDIAQYDSKVTASSGLTIATVGSNNTTTTVTGKVKTYPRGNQNPESIIEIRETSVNSIKDGSVQHIKLVLPKGVTWQTTTPVVIGGNLGTRSGSFTVSDRTCEFDILVAGDPKTRQLLTLKPQIIIGKDAVMGDITVQLIGSISSGAGNAISDAADLLIAKYGEEAVEIKTIDDIPEIVAGYNKDKNGKSFYVYATLKETMAGSLSLNRPVDFAFTSDSIQINGPISASTTEGKNGTFSTITNYLEIGSDSLTNTNINDTVSSGITKDEASDTSYFTFTVPKKNVAADPEAAYGPGDWKSTANTVTFKIPVTVEANYTGDIELVVDGAKAGVDETTLTVGTAISPITVTTTSAEVKNGVQSQAVADITIVENIPGYLDDRSGLNEVKLTVDDLKFNGIKFTDYESVKVVDGNLDIEKDDTDDNAIVFKVKNSSTKASTIEIKGAVVALNRVMPEGGYDLLVGGEALVQNGDQNDGDFTGNAAKVKDFISIITPAESVTVSEKVDAKFVIGEASYTNNGAATEMDAAAYIDSHNRTMVPIRYVANACGISENDIRWEAGSQTAIINGLNTVVTVKMGSNKLQTSTGEITMDTVAVNNNGRIYVPVRYIANALGANVSWDAATKTVTLTK